jgi:hypothetical protein
MQRSRLDSGAHVARMLKRKLCILAALAAGVTAAPAQAQTVSSFGRTSVGTLPSNGLSAHFKRASRFTLTAPGTFLQLCAYLDGKGGVSGSQPVRLALYQDANGAPGTKVLETPEWTILSGDAARWFCQPKALTPIPAGRYWIAIHSSDPGGVIRDFYDGSANWYGNADAFADGSANSFGSGSAGNGTLSVYARYYPDSQVRNAGRTTIGTTPSSGMTLNFKRGSSFVMPERGKLMAITPYLDGLGTTSTGDQQALRFVLYKDANGVPGARVYEGGTTYLRGGWAADWRTDMAYAGTAPTLDAGRYWFIIHTGGIVGNEGVGGVIRNFADGSGNWYGNSDVFADGASTPFGAGKVGNGTLSAYISYRPGTITTGQLGRADIATTPSRGLTPNVMRWSTFTLTEGAGTLTGLHAYLDGLGSASGSQPVRMVMYGLRVERDDNHNQTGVYFKVAESGTVNVAAGMQPRWVDFAVPPATIGHGDVPLYLVAIQSGGTVGVARDYGDNRSDQGANWASMPDAFADGAIATFTDGAPITSGDVTMSVYASYTLTPP